MSKMCMTLTGYGLREVEPIWKNVVTEGVL